MPDEAGHFLWVNSICHSLAGIDDLWRREKTPTARCSAARPAVGDFSLGERVDIFSIIRECSGVSG